MTCAPGWAPTGSQQGSHLMAPLALGKSQPPNDQISKSPASSTQLLAVNRGLFFKNLMPWNHIPDEMLQWHPTIPQRKPESFNLQNNLFYILIQATSLISIPPQDRSLPLLNCLTRQWSTEPIINANLFSKYSFWQWNPGTPAEHKDSLAARCDHMTRFRPIRCKGKWCLLPIGYSIEEKLVALHFLFFLRGKKIHVLVINQLWPCRWRQHPGKWHSNKIEGTWVPEGLQTTPLLCLVLASLKIRIWVHLFQRWFQETSGGSGGVKQIRERNNKVYITKTFPAWAVRTQSQWEYREHVKHDPELSCFKGKGAEGDRKSVV